MMQFTINSNTTTAQQQFDWAISPAAVRTAMARVHAPNFASSKITVLQQAPGSNVNLAIAGLENVSQNYQIPVSITRGAMVSVQGTNFAGANTVTVEID